MSGLHVFTMLKRYLFVDVSPSHFYVLIICAVDQRSGRCEAALARLAASLSRTGIARAAPPALPVLSLRAAVPDVSWGCGWRCHVLSGVT